MLSEEEILEELLFREEARTDLGKFCTRISDIQPARHHRLLCDKLEDVAYGRTKRLMVFMPPGHAKALALDTPILTTDGWKTMGTLSVGDKVYGTDGKPCNVTWKSPIWKDRPVYKVKTDCGESIIADEAHEWEVRLCGKREVYKIVETIDLAKKRSKRPMIKRAEALEMPYRELPIDPYVLGVWLGDGSKESGHISCAVSDKEWMKPQIESLGYRCNNLSITASFSILDIRGSLNSLGVLHNKHIPEEYMMASKSQRLHLLQGLIDTDGTVSPKGQITFCNTNKKLALQVQLLARSLGVKATLIEGKAMLYGKDCGPYYRISFYLEFGSRMPRKRIRTRNASRTPNFYIEATYEGIADTQCIEVDYHNHLYLAGYGLVPTHNSTYSSVHFPAFYLGVNPDKCIIGASHTQDLADRFSRKTRNIVGCREFYELYNFGIASDSRAMGAWETEKGGEYKATGVGSGIAGRRSDVGLIDDPIRSREDAESELVRDRIWEWYLGDFYTRLKPGGSIIIIQCMVGDTRVLLANGSEKELRNIKVGDEVATYEDGKVTSSKVLNWMDQGSDNIFTVKTISRTVKANERHPFLVQSKTGELQWVRLRDLKPGDLLVSLKDAKNPQGQLQDRENAELAKQKIGITSKILNLKDKIRDIGGNAKVKLASLMNAPVLSTVLGCAKSIMGSIIGLTLERKERTSKKSGKDISSTDMGSLWINIMISLISKTAYAPFVDNLQQEKIHDYTGEISYASTTATTAERLEVYFATTATSQLDTQKLGKSPLQLLNISDFTVEEVIAIDPAGKEVVYDIQVERTENFVANGLVVSNTRWHEDDLAGRILPTDYHGQSGPVKCLNGEIWEVVNFPAICEQDNDALNRKIGDALWPEYYDLQMLQDTKRMQTPRNWASLYKQRPRAEESNQFDLAKLLNDGQPLPFPKWCDSVYAVIDTASKDGNKHDATACTYFAYNRFDPNPVLILDWELVQIEGALLEEWLPSVIDKLENYSGICGARLGSQGAFIEDKASGTILIQQAIRRGLPARAIDSPLTGVGKTDRAVSVSGYVYSGKVKLTENAYNKREVYKGRERNHLVFQVVNFRAGMDNKTDDLIDTFTYGIALALGNHEAY